MSRTFARTSALSTLLLLPTIALITQACPVGKATLSSKDLKKLKSHLNDRAAIRKKMRARGVAATAPAMPILPTANSEQPWGGKNSSAWKSEAVLANAVSRALNDGWAAADTDDVLVSVPVTMLFTGKDRPYGDGQTNASLTFGANWPHKEPQVVAALIKTKHGRRLSLRFSSKLSIEKPRIAITAWTGEGANQTKKVESLALTQEATTDDYIATWNVPADLQFGDVENAHVLWLTLEGKEESFPLDFRLPVYKTYDLAKAAGGARTVGRSPLDPIAVRARARAPGHASGRDSGQLIQAALMDSVYGDEWVRVNGSPMISNTSIHGSFNGVPTAVGGGHTWLVERGPNSTFKNLYTCFDERRSSDEERSGVPSGGGWHEIGDAAETIINNLEDGPIVVGYATGAPETSAPDGRAVAFQNRDITTVRFLRPDEAMMTGAGKTTWAEDTQWRPEGGGPSHRGEEPSGKGRNYHWFFFHSEDPVCTQEWVHPCLPTKANNFGLDPKNDPANCNLKK